MNITPDNITTLAPHEIFCYGSNQAWRHGAGAAKTALKWGAIYGEGPFRGQTYGICTKDERIRTLPLTDIQREVDDFTRFVAANRHLHFLVTRIGCGLANWTPSDIAPLFCATSYLSNISLPVSFWTIINTHV